MGCSVTWMSMPPLPPYESGASSSLSPKKPAKLTVTGPSLS
jgi:hypothetical protein